MKAISIFAVYALTTSAVLAQDTVRRLTVEPNHSTIGFSVPIGGGLTLVTGKFTDFDLNFDYVENKLANSTVVFNIQVASINTGITDRDAHLRTADFFDAEKYPRITFRSTKITPVDKGFIMEGIFDMHGVQQVVVFPVEITGNTDNTIGIQIRWQLDRTTYGVGNNFKHTTMKNFLSDKIDIEINLWTKLDKRPGSGKN